MIVIVGTNGSGKSTLINLLTRLYDPISGEVLLDGHPVSEYRLADIRQAVATLTQDNTLFPLSLSQNIALGNISQVGDQDLIDKAAKLGGASACIARLQDGSETVSDPVTVPHGTNLAEDPEDPLQKLLRKARKTIQVSGGERQRMVAYVVL